MAIDRERLESVNGLDSQYSADDWYSFSFDQDLSGAVPRAIESLTDGQVTIVNRDGHEVTVLLIAGVPKPVRPHRVKDPGGSTASGLVAYL